MVSLTIDGIPVEVPENTTVLDAARQVNIEIPTLCYLREINAIGACRICLVEVKGNPALQAACVLPVSEGMEVVTNSEKVRSTRKTALELLLSTHERDCLTCVRNQNCELQRLSEDFGVRSIPYEGERIEKPIDDRSPSVVRDPNKCVLCKRCVAVCRNVQSVGALGTTQRGFRTMVEPVWGKSLADVPCINCGQCIAACPVGALTEKSDIDIVWDALHDPNKHVVIQPAPAVRTSIGEEFGMPMGELVTGKLVTALRRLHFDRVFDTDFGADLTIMEEGHELIHRMQEGGVLPQITSCSPGWVKFCETYFPDMIENLSSCKSPHQMLGALVKSYYAEREGIPPESIVTVSVMPCTAKKFERTRPGEAAGGVRDVDVVLTVREMARMIKDANIDFPNLPDGEFDTLLGESTGAGVIFGVTGGVMEAALRTVADVLTGQDLDSIEYTDVRGLTGIKEAEVQIGERSVRVAVAHGLANARALLEAVRNGDKEFDFIEIMGCPGGCVNGGGQPIVSSRERNMHDPRAVRATSQYRADKSSPVRKAHENSELQTLYETYLGEPNSHKAHRLLHTYYVPRRKYASEG